MKFVLEKTKSKYNDVFKKLLDLGDFVGIEGELIHNSKLVKKQYRVKDFTLLSKALKPLTHYQKQTKKELLFDAVYMIQK